MSDLFSITMQSEHLPSAIEFQMLQFHSVNIKFENYLLLKPVKHKTLR